jgi:hypothetical protein
MKNIYLLPTDKPSRLYIDNKGKYNLEIGQIDFKTFKNIYITSDEQVKEGDYYVSLILDGKKIWKTTKIDCITKADLNKTNEYLVEPFSKYCKKLVLTTDTQLIKDGVQEIGDEFLEWFVKNPSCEEVMVDKFISERYFCTNPIIPKEEPKPHSFCETPEEKCTMNYCDENGCQNRKRELVELKQETLEEASWKHNPLKKLDGEFLRHAFREGAIFQKEQDKNKYSEEEVKDMLFEALNKKQEQCCITNTKDSIVREVLKQFKKK